jgi:hypothetical protein
MISGEGNRVERLVRYVLVALWLLPLSIPCVHAAQPVGFDSDASILAVITHKGGFASGLAHNHLIAADGYTARLDLDPGNPADLRAARFTLEAPVAGLRVDEDPLRAETFPRLRALGILDAPFEELSEKDRRKIGDAMRGKSQLDATAHPTITVQVLSVEQRATEIGGESFPWSARLAFTVHGVTVERAVPVRVVVAAGRVTLEAVGEFRFTDFGIKPYSAALGAVKNQDGFHLYARIVVATGHE